MEKITVYLYQKCSTCQKAIAFLEEKGLKEKCTFKEIVKTPPSLEELKKMLEYQKGSLRKLFNTSGKLYREMELSKKLANLSEKEALKLLSEHGMLVKRPFLLTDSFGAVGFKEAEWEKGLKN